MLRASTRTARRPRSRGFTDRGRVLLSTGLLLAAGGALLGFVDLTLVGAFCAAVPLLARLVAWRRRPRLQVDRTVAPAPLVAGRPGRITVRVRNAGPRGCDPLAAAEHVSPWLGSTARLVLPPLRPGQDSTGSYDVRPARRGRHQAGPLRVVSRDPLGLTHVGAAVGAPLELLVLPPVHDLSSGDPIGLGMGHEGDAPANVLAGTEHDVSVREYRQGDDLRRVHWGVTAHRGRLMVRHEALPRLRRAVLLLDASAAAWDPPGAGPSGAVRSGSGGRPDEADGADVDTAFEWAVEAVASIAAHLAGLGFTLHLLVPGAAPEAFDRSEDPARPLLLQDVLTRLALVRPGPREGVNGYGGVRQMPGAAGSVAAAAREVAGAGGLVVLVTGDRSRGSAEETFGVLRTGLAGLAVVVDTAAFARCADRAWWIPKPPDPGASTAPTVAPAAAHDAAPTARSNASASDDARRLCAYARSGGWRAVPAGPGTTPAHAWEQLLGTTRSWSAAPAPASTAADPLRRPTR